MLLEHIAQQHTNSYKELSVEVRMSGGRDVLIVGIAGKDMHDALETVASPETLKKLFGGNFPNDRQASKFHEWVHRLEKDPSTSDPGLYYITGENFLGSVQGTGLGYVLFSGNLNASPKHVDDLLFARIPEFKERFIRELHSHKLSCETYTVGVHAINVYDT